jgi:hypothetical protein
MPISLKLIRNKALSLFKELKRKSDENVAGDKFIPSHAYFQRFKGRSKLHNTKATGETASSDVVEATEFSTALVEIIKY